MAADRDDELPSRVGLLPGEADLVTTYLMEALQALLAGEACAPTPNRKPLTDPTIAD